MSSSRLIYDDCAYEQRLKESTNPLRYMLNPQKYENCNKCRYELGLLGGANVSINSGNLVDVESDLSGRTRPLTECSANKYKPTLLTQVLNVRMIQVFHMIVMNVNQ